MFPALDLGGFTRRTVIPASYITFVEGIAPGFTQQQILTRMSSLYSRLRKRYAATIPFGTAPAQPDASGTSPPLLTLSGVPTVGSIQIIAAITLAGSLGASQFKWSADNGNTYAAAVATGAAVVLAGTGITASFGVGNYSLDNLYVCATPYPEAALGWIVDGVSVDVLRKHGVNTQDPQIMQVFERFKEVWGPDGEIFQAANSQEGLFDLPDNDKDGATDISSGGPLFYTESSPFVSADQQEFYGRQEDCNSFRGSTSPPFGTSGGA